MLRLSSLAIASFPWAALAAQVYPRAVPSESAPLAPLWIAVGVVIVVALLAVLVGGPRVRARAHAGAGRGAPPPR